MNFEIVPFHTKSGTKVLRIMENGYSKTSLKFSPDDNIIIELSGSNDIGNIEIEFFDKKRNSAESYSKNGKYTYNMLLEIVSKQLTKSEIKNNF